ncbi:TNF receptor-associated factor 3-like isoform X2 [Dendronephthya gigantea]|uniref:TNF receptor-associated factor 3-like isoform X2 n=1 Tax=Dendronephthya gigantea TaxID=151771 RepID=UPI00106C40D7|nr:TNF receptor-associated factor 3-like isoform X2 [Dendronephthya gigantea]
MYLLMTGTKITDGDRKRIDSKFICIICHFLLFEPVQTICGHLMCLSCFETLLGSSTPRCPEDGEELSKEKAFSDAFTKRELNSLEIHCANPDCTWTSSYDKLEIHSQVCEHAIIQCVHSQCKNKIKRSHLGEHLKKECEYRSASCQYCRKDVAFASMKEHVATSCEAAPVTCKYCKQKVLRRDLEEHKKLVCDEIPGECIFKAVGCNQEIVKRKELEQHMSNRIIDHVRLLLQFVFTFASQLKDYIPRPEFTGIMQKIRSDITEVRSGVAEKFVLLVEKVTGLERRVEGLESNGQGDAGIERDFHELVGKVRDLSTESGNLRERLITLERELREKSLHFERFRSRADQVDEALALNTVKITDLESQRGPSAQQRIHSYNGTLLWKIEGYQRKRQDAINGVKTALYSPHFYSAQYGYKMCAKIYMNGDGFGKGSHLSLFFVVMKGDYDALQTWPFQKKITMMLLDQGNGDHMVDAFHSDPQSSSFQRPRSDMNIASGSPLFMPIDHLDNRQYIKDDVIFIKIIVD